jgi:hypothetical protein
MTDQVQAQTTEQAAPQLQLQDLMLVAQIIQLTSQRGAIKPEEMEAVGGVYTRIVSFLQASGALQPAEQATTAPSADPATASAVAQ